MGKKLFVKTYGCQMNVYDSGRMADVLAPLGFETVATPDDADLVILNTCHIREKAAEKVYSELGRLRPLKEARARRGARMTIAVAGCVAQAEGAAIRARAPFVDIVLGPQAYHHLPAILARVSRAGSAIDTDFPAEPKFDFLPEESRPPGPAAFLTVQEGCDRFCTFCVVPYTRGAESSRPVAEVEAEARRLAAKGARELILLGQNVNAYHGRTPEGGECTLAGLIERLAAIEGIVRIRYTTSHPRDMTEDLVAAHGACAKLMPFLHLPVQSGSDRILEAMNRRHRAEDYLGLVERLRAARPDIALSSDFIVGFPGESEADFEATLALARAVRFAQAYSFKYSPRPGTPAAEMDGQVPDAVKAERLGRLQAALDADQRAFNESCVGREVEVLFERPGRRSGQCLGRSPYMQAVHVPGPRDLLGRLGRVAITEGQANSLGGRLLAGGPERPEGRACA